MGLYVRLVMTFCSCSEHSYSEHIVMDSLSRTSAIVKSFEEKIPSGNDVQATELRLSSVHVLIMVEDAKKNIGRIKSGDF